MRYFHIYNRSLRKTKWVGRAESPADALERYAQDSGWESIAEYEEHLVRCLTPSPFSASEIRSWAADRIVSEISRETAIRLESLIDWMDGCDI